MGIITDIIKRLPFTAVLEDNLKKTEQERDQLKEKNESLEASNFILEKENQSLRQELSTLQQPPTKRSETEEKVLIQLWCKDPDLVYAVDIERALGIVEAMADYHLQDLASSNLVTAHYNLVDGTRYSITQDGKRYLIRNKLVE